MHIPRHATCIHSKIIYMIFFQGAIVVGNDADFAVWEPEMEFVLDDNYKTYHKHPVCVIPYAYQYLSKLSDLSNTRLKTILNFIVQNNSPYMGMKLSGKVWATFVRGNLVFSKGTHATAACGTPILAQY